MPKITLKIMFGPLRSMIGLDEYTVEVESFKELLDKISEKYGEQIYELFLAKNGKDYPFNHIIIDGKIYRASEIMNIKFHEDKIIYIWPALNGGV